MLKFLGVLMILLSTSLFGIISGIELKSRKKDLQEIRKILLLIKSKIEYLNMPINEIFNNLSKELSYPYNQAFKKIYEEMSGEYFDTNSNISEIWSENIEWLCKNNNLTKEQVGDLVMFGDNLRIGDSKVLIGVIEMYEEKLLKETQELSDSINEKIKVYGWLGVMAGAFVTIILI